MGSGTEDRVVPATASEELHTDQSVWQSTKMGGAPATTREEFATVPPTSSDASTSASLPLVLGCSLGAVVLLVLLSVYVYVRRRQRSRPTPEHMEPATNSLESRDDEEVVVALHKLDSQEFHPMMLEELRQTSVAPLVLEEDPVQASIRTEAEHQAALAIAELAARRRKRSSSEEMTRSCMEHQLALDIAEDFARLRDRAKQKDDYAESPRSPDYEPIYDENVPGKADPHEGSESCSRVDTSANHKAVTIHEASAPLDTDVPRENQADHTNPIFEPPNRFTFNLFWFNRQKGKEKMTESSAGASSSSETYSRGKSSLSEDEVIGSDSPSAPSIISFNDMYNQSASGRSSFSHCTRGSSLSSRSRKADEISYEVLIDATENFAFDNMVGSGGFGSVYEGWLQNKHIAVKRFCHGSMQGSNEFHNEIKVLSRIRHRNIVKLLGFCTKPLHECIVYEFFLNGSLQEWLLPASISRGCIDWRRRIMIAADIARALLFLHSAPTGPILHGDVKPSNIGLDRWMVAKVSDVGLARFVLHEAQSWEVSEQQQSLLERTNPKIDRRDTTLKGDFSYLDPAYVLSGQYSAKSDLYALGVCIFQLVTGSDIEATSVDNIRTNIYEYLVSEETLISQDGWTMVSQYVDKLVVRDWPSDSVLAFVRVALSCTEPEWKDRPTTIEVLSAIEEISAEQNEYNKSDGLSDKLAIYCPTFSRRTSSKKRKLYSEQAVNEAIGPSIFYCPITQEMMENPVVAGDGFTYERTAIQQWFKQRQVSPMTNRKVENTDVTPNYTLKSAIREFRALLERQRDQT